MVVSGQIAPKACYTFVVDNTDALQRLDIYLAEHFEHYSRAFFQDLIRSGAVICNQVATNKPSLKVKDGDTILVTFPDKRTVEPATVEEKALGVKIISTTDHFMIIYKPPHLLVHPASIKNKTVTLVDWIKHNHTDIADVGCIDRPGIVHRLDKETSGLMIVTRTNYAHSVFQKLFKERTISKTYYALVSGHPAPQGTIDYAIGRDPYNRIKMTHFDEALIDEDGMIKNMRVRSASSSYKVITYFENSTLVEIMPKTGRTHQIRVHMTAIGHCIIGDELYGTKSALIDRQALHAHSISFMFDDKPYTFTVDLPEDFQNLIDNQKSVLD